MLAELLLTATKVDYAATLVEQMNHTYQKRCPFCGSPDLAVYDLVVAGHGFDYDQVCRRRIEQGLTVLTVTITKVENDPKIQYCTNPLMVTPGFMVMVFRQMGEWAADRPDKEFSAGPDGTFVFCVSASWDETTYQAEVNQKYYACQNLTKAEVIAAFVGLRDKYSAQRSR